MSYDDIIADLTAYLEYERDEGGRQVAISRETLDALTAPPRHHAIPAPEFNLSPQPASADRRASDATPVAGTEPPVPAEDSLERVAAEVARCTRCALHASRTNTVPGQGSAAPEIVFVGEGPGADEDAQGLAFVGRAGQLLTKMIEAMGLTREDVFICNVVKCRPPGNRKPELAEMAACLPYLKRQIALLQPKVIIALGATALNGLVDLPDGMGITRARGTWMRFAGIDLMPTFHPAYLLRNANMKKYVWEDLQTVLRHLGKPIPPVKKR